MRPKRRNGLLTRKIDNELLVFDQASSEGHALNETAAAVFRLCDGETAQTSMVAALSLELGRAIDPEIVELAIAELADAGLLIENEATAPPINRRAVIRRLGLSVAAAAALPLVETMIARPASAQGSFGPTGPTGATGSTGPTGATGATG